MTPLEAAQATAIGAVLERPEIAGEVFAAVDIPDFDPPYRQVAEAIHGLRLDRKPITTLSVIDELNRRGSLGRMGGPAEVHRIAGFGFGDHGYAVDVITRTIRLRRLDVTALRLHQAIEHDDAEPLSLAKAALAEVQGVVDTCEADGDITTPTLGEFLDSEDAPYDWVIPGLLERGDRLILTGAEGLGKSVLNRQIAVCAAAGVNPFTRARFTPQTVLYVDCENGPAKLRRHLRGLAQAVGRLGEDPRYRMHLEAIPAGLDLTKPADETWLIKRVSAIQPALLMIGPIYRLHADDPNKEEPARKVTQVLDRARMAANCAIVTEAHAGHGYGDQARPLRPTGTSLWLRWPEFGYGMQPSEGHTAMHRRVAFRSWRGDREERDWPTNLASGGMLPWTLDHSYDQEATA